MTCLAALLLTSCSIRRFVPQGEHFLNKNKVVIEGKDVEFDKSNIKTYITQEPFKTGFPHKTALWLYYVTEKSQGGFGRWINRYFGKVPEYYDNDAAINSAKQIEQYLNNRGYFNSKVTLKTKKETAPGQCHLYHRSHRAIPYQQDRLPDRGHGAGPASDAS